MTKRRLKGGQHMEQVYVGTLEKGMIQISSGTKQNSKRFHPTIQNSTQCKTHVLFIPGILHLYFRTVVDNGKPMKHRGDFCKQ